MDFNVYVVPIGNYVYLEKRREEEREEEKKRVGARDFPNSTRVNLY